MKRFAVSLGVLMLTGALAACGGRDEAAPEPPAPEPAAAPAEYPEITDVEVVVEPAEEVAEEVIEEVAETAAEIADEAADAAEDVAEAVEEGIEEMREDADDLHASLVGTSWMLGDIAVTFEDEENLQLKGGPIAAFSPDGLAGTYSFENGVITVSAMGQTRTGTWDGETLVVDGQAATPQ